MADYEEKKSSIFSLDAKTHPATPIVILFAIALIIGAIFVRVGNFVSSRQTLQNFLHQLWLFLNGEASISDVIGTGNSTIVTIFFVLKIFSLVISILIIWLLFSTVRKLTKVNEKLWADLKPPKGLKDPSFSDEAALRAVNPKWEKVQQHINSENSSDWKLAILEADIILDEMLDKMGYRADTMGEKLKMVEPSDFLTLDVAWEAHKIRNSIAHEGSDFLINRREADRVIGLYKAVFEEFKFI